MVTEHARRKLAEARAILHSVRSSLCPHGVRWSACKDTHDTYTTTPPPPKREEAR